MTQDLSHLSALDGAFLHLESPEMPMHVGSLALFDPPADGAASWLDALKAHVQSRMHLAPVFTRKLEPMPFDLMNPVWIRDDDIDIDYHIRHTVLPRPGTMAQLEALCARLHSSLLDRSRPLWEFYVIEGLADGRVGFYSKVHHAAVDGQAAVAMANSVFDLAREPRRVRPPRAPRTHRYRLGVAELMSAALGNQARQAVQFVKLLPPLAGTAIARGRTAIADRLRRRGAPAGGTAFKLAPVTPFNVSITNQRAFASVSLPLDETKAIGRSVGASVNDMVLWLVSTALREYLREGRELPGRTLVAGVPVSLRAEGDTTSNNQVTGSLVDLATQEADPIARLDAIRAATAAMKSQMGAFRDLIPTDVPSIGSPWLMSGLASLYGRSRMAHRLRIANVVVSNVPGPQVPLWLAGARMTGMFPLSIVVHGVALNITVQSYMGQLCFGLIACRRAVPDLPELAAQLRSAMEAARALSTSAAGSAQAIAADAIASAAAKAGSGEPVTAQVAIQTSEFQVALAGRRRAGTRAAAPREDRPADAGAASTTSRARRSGSGRMPAAPVLPDGPSAGPASDEVPSAAPAPRRRTRRAPAA